MFDINPNIIAIEKKFASYTKGVNVNNLVEEAILVENFIYDYFQIPRLEKWYNEKIEIVKRDFIKREVFLEYVNKVVEKSWEDLYCFTTQEKFIEDVLQNINEDIKKYTAFALFTEEGRSKHRLHDIFHLPQNTSEKNCFLTEKDGIIKSKIVIKRNGFNLTDEFPSQNKVDWNVGYCLYCHKRGKDSCSKGLNEEKSGCPLRQDISESIFLKRNNYHIASLAAIMRNNPFCILTGRRICNDCEEACIFQKQEAVDIQSLETAILNDILNMPFGLEIYNLLLWWNPLRNEKAVDLSQKNVAVAGLGPAGLFATYEFLKNGANVFGFDALNIKITPKLEFIANNIVEDISPLLNENLSHRMPSNIGGVMEYGITARWNKNYLDILIGLLLRRKNIKFIGNIRIGNFLTYDDILNHYKFNHIALCVGSARPKLPFYIQNLFTGYSLTKGVMMASDFLMSLHLNRESNFLENFVKSPAYILGCGLTGIDTACETLALLKSYGVENPIVKILYYDNFKKASGYKKNHLEFKKALEEGIEIIQNIEIQKITTKDGIINAFLTKNNEIVECKTLIIAIGTEPNTSHIIDFIGKDNISFFGDCNPQYTGSVVNALASVKNGIQNAMKQTFENQNIAQYLEEFTENHNINIREISNDFYEVRINSPLLLKKIKIGNVLKLQVMYQNSVALTVLKIENNEILLYMQNTNDDTQGILNAYKNGETIYITGINCGNFPNITEEIIITTPKGMMIFKNIFPNNRFLLPHQIKGEYSEKNKYFIAIEDEKIQKEVMEIVKNAEIFIFNKMNCMLGGICGRCVKPNGEYACVNNIEATSY